MTPIFLTFLRMAGLLMIAPMFAGKFVPVRFRVLLALAMTLVVGSMQISWGTLLELPDWTSVAFWVAAGGEVFLGVTMGASVLFLFAALQVAGSTMAHISGLSFPVDAGLSNEASNILVQFFFLMGTAVLFLTNGHHRVLEALFQSIDRFPVGTVVLGPDILRETWTMFSLGFTLGVQMALPAIAVLLLAQVGLAILCRVLPQLNLFALSFAVNALLVLAILSLGLGVSLWVWEEQFLRLAA